MQLNTFLTMTCLLAGKNGSGKIYSMLKRLYIIKGPNVNYILAVQKNV